MLWYGLSFEQAIQDNDCFAGDPNVSNRKSYAMMKYVWKFTGWN